MSKRYDEMNLEELKELASEMSYYALDLAQHLFFTKEMLAEEYKEKAYDKATKMAYNLAFCIFGGEDYPIDSSDLCVFGENGLEHPDLC